MYDSKQWYAVYTHARLEKKAADRLAGNKVESFCPLNKAINRHGDKKKAVFEPLFPSYVFVHASEKELKSVKESSHVVNLVYWLNKPAVISDEEIDAIKDFVEHYRNIRLEKAEVSMDGKIRITNDTLMHKEGRVIEVQPKMVKLYLPSLGYNMIAEFEKSSLELVGGFTAGHQLVS